MKKYIGIRSFRNLLHQQHYAIFKLRIGMPHILQLSQHSRKSKIWMHVIGWIIFAVYELVMMHLQGAIVTWPQLFGTLPFYVVNLGFFYLTYKICNESFVHQERKFAKAIILFLGALVLAVAIKMLLDFIILSEDRFRTILTKGRIGTYLVSSCWRTTYFGMLGFGYWSTVSMIKYSEDIIKSNQKTIALLQEKSLLEKNLTDARFAFHQQQINPHFLFNTLNFIYNSVYRHSREASNAVILLSEIMRYSLDDMDAEGKASIEREVEQIENLIEINKLRFNSNLHVDFKIDGDYESVRFIPLILLTFAENVFKYGQLKDGNKPAKMHLAVTEDGKLVFETWNAKKQGRLLKDSTGIGVNNAIKRLEHAYGERFDLQIKDEDQAYGLKLTVTP